MGVFEPQHDKNHQNGCAPSEDSDQPRHPPSLIRVFALVWSESSLSAWRKLGSLATHWAHSEDSGQTGRMPRLIWVRWAHSHFVGFVMLWLIYGQILHWNCLNNGSNCASRTVCCRNLFLIKSQCTRKLTKWYGQPVKTQINLWVSTQSDLYLP